MPSNVADLPREKFPVLIEALHVSTREVVWDVRVEAPTKYGDRVPVKIPPLSTQFGHPVAIRMTFGDGEVCVTEPPKVN